MCGLVGVAGKILRVHEGVFKDLLVVDSLRGKDSTGVLISTRLGNTIVKSVGDAYELLGKHKFTSSLPTVNNLLMGHNRWASKGAVNKSNAHPFEFDNVIGAHNGTLTTQYKLDDSNDFAVDSENLFYHLDKHGVEDTASKLGGSFALTWYNKVDNTINFLRNDLRPLHYTTSLDGCTLFWASEVWMLEGILGRNRVEHTGVKEFPTYLHHSISIQSYGNVQPDSMTKFVTNIIDEPVLSKPKTKYLPAKTTTVANLSDWQEASALKMYEGTNVRFYVTTVEEVSIGKRGKVLKFIKGCLSDAPSVDVRLYAKVDSPLWRKLTGEVYIFTADIKKVSRSSKQDGYKPFCVVDLRTVEEEEDESEDLYGGWGLEDEEAPGYLLGTGGVLLNKLGWEKATRNGCAWCSQTPSVNEHTELVWIDSSNFICADCVSSSEVREYLHL